MDNVGFHCSIDSVQSLVSDPLGFKTFQVFVSNPMARYSPNRLSVMKVASILEAGFNCVVHAPYLTSLVRLPMREFTIYYVVDFFHMLREFTKKQCHLVVHTNKPKDNTEGDTWENMLTWIPLVMDSMSKHKISNYSIAIETDASRKSKHTSLRGIFEIISSVKEATNFSICFDTEHSYASGFISSEDIKDSQIWDRVSVVHLNAIPDKVGFGSGLDRHSDTLLKDTKNDLFFNTSFLKEVFHEAINRKLPIILERSDMDIIKEDFNYLKGWYADR